MRAESWGKRKRDRNSKVMATRTEQEAEGMKSKETMGELRCKRSPSERVNAGAGGGGVFGAGANFHYQWPRAREVSFSISEGLNGRHERGNDRPR